MKSAICFAHSHIREISFVLLFPAATRWQYGRENYFAYHLKGPKIDPCRKAREHKGLNKSPRVVFASALFVARPVSRIHEFVPPMHWADKRSCCSRTISRLFWRTLNGPGHCYDVCNKIRINERAYEKDEKKEWCAMFVGNLSIWGLVSCVALSFVTIAVWIFISEEYRLKILV